MQDLEKTREQLLQELGKLKFFKHVFDQLPVCAIIYDCSGKVVYRNKVTKRVDGYDDGEMLGLARKEYLERLQINPGTDKPVVLTHPGQDTGSLKDGIYCFNETTLITKEGAKKNVLLLGDFIYDEEDRVLGACGCCIDITEFVAAQKKTEEALEAERRILFSLLDSLPAMVYLQAPDYTIPFSNRYFWEQFGKPGKRPCYEILNSRQDPCTECPTFQIFETKKPQTWEWTSPAGQVYQVYAYPFPGDSGSPLVLVLCIDITGRKQAEEALHKSEERYRLLFNSASDAMFVHGLTSEKMPTNFWEVNDIACQELGYTREELLRLSPADIWAAYHPEKTLALMKKLVTNKHVIFEKEYKTKEGKKIFTEINAHLFDFNGKPAVLSISRNITQRKLAEEALKASEERFSRAFHASPCMMFISRLSDNKIIDINDSFLSATGCRRENAINCTIDQLFANPKELLDIIHTLREGNPARNLEIKFRTKPGEVRFGLLSAELIEISGEPCLLVAMNDITERKQLEKEMARLERLNLIGEMAAGIGHEIRNPMTTVRGFLQLLEGKEECRKYRHYFALMIEELDRANAIITEYLSLAKNRSIELKEHNLMYIITTLLPLIQADAMREDKFVEVDLGVIPDLFLDEKEIRQLILNLVRNGLEAMPSGGKLTIKTFMAGNEAVLAVQDQGAGIKPDILEKIGTPFFTTKDYGTGLGLAVCYSIAARHNAFIQVETGPRGTTFSVRFKTARAIVDGQRIPAADPWPGNSC